MMCIYCVWREFPCASPSANDTGRVISIISVIQSDLMGCLSCYYMNTITVLNPTRVCRKTASGPGYVVKLRPDPGMS